MRSTFIRSRTRVLTSRPAVAVYTLSVAVAFAGGAAFASIPAPNGVIDACYATKSPHTLRVIDSAQKCPSGTTALNWSIAGPPGPGGVDGIQEFTHSGTWTAPTGVTHVMVEIWGAGGGGGGGSITSNCSSGAVGGGGGGGGYVRTVIPVTAGQSYAFAVGASGVAGSDGTVGTNGGSGGNTTVSAAVTVLVFADGGAGGSGATTTGPGSPGAGGVTSSGAVTRPGEAGDQPAGGTSFRGTMDVQADGGAAGQGGPNDCGQTFVEPQPGGAGYVLLTW
jgi:glycine rich protein